MPILSLTDTNLQPIDFNTNEILFVGPTMNPGQRGVCLKFMLPTGLLTIPVVNSRRQVLERWQAALSGEPVELPAESPIGANGR